MSATWTSTRRLAIGLVLLAILALAVAVVTAPDPGGQPSQSGLAIPAPQEDSSPSEQPSDSESVSTDGDVDELLPLVTYEVFLSRDPFEPVVPAPGDDGGVVDGGATDGNGGTDGGTTGGTTGGSDGGTTGGTTGGTGGTDGGTTGDGTGGTTDGSEPTGRCVKENDAQARCDHVVTLVDVYVDDSGTERAVVQIDDQLYDVSSGQEFAVHFSVKSIEPPCVTLMYGDDVFSLCEGEQVLK